MMIMNLQLEMLFNDEMLAFIAYVFLYLTYFFFNDFSFVKTYRLRFNESKHNIEASVYLRRTVGFILLGGIPLLLIVFVFDRPLIDFGIGLPSGPYAWLWFLAPILVITLMSVFRPSKGIDLDYYPEVRKAAWTKKRFWMNAGFWTLYLLGYEFALRGMLFFSMLYAFGLWPAIIINSVIYALIHIFKGSGEAYGAFFLGVLFCLITYYTNSIWIVVIAHVILAVVNDVKAVNRSIQIHQNHTAIQ